MAEKLKDDRYSECISELIEPIAVGEACYAFFNSDVGRYLLLRASETEEQAFREWLEVDPSDAKAIRECQEKAAIPKLVIAWLRDAVKEGEAAQQQAEQLIAEENENG